MDKMVDSFVAWVVCAVFAVVSGGLSVFSVVGFLASFSVICARHVLRACPVRAALVVAFLVACASIPIFRPFLPAAACLCAYEDAPVIRFGWIAGWAIAAASDGMAASLPLLALCCAMSALAVCARRTAAERLAARALRDGMSEKVIGLSESNRDMAVALEERRADRDAERQRAREEALADLTERERSIADLVAQGFDNREIASRLYLSEGTVRNNISAILAKKQLKNRTQLAVLALQGASG